MQRTEKRSEWTPKHQARPVARLATSRTIRTAAIVGILAMGLIGVPGPAEAQLYDYSIIGQYTDDFWNGSGDSEFNIQTVTTGFQVGRMQEEGFGTEWAATVLLPLSLTFDGEDTTDTASLEDANFSTGFGFRFGVGFGFSPMDRLLVTPGIAYHAMYVRYSFDFPGGATEYYEFTHGPAAVAQVAFAISPRFHLQGGAMFAYSPFHAGNISNSGSDEDMLYSLTTRGWIGVRMPVLSRGALNRAAAGRWF